jgi:hypothetical protein
MKTSNPSGRTSKTKRSTTRRVAGKSAAAPKRTATKSKKAAIDAAIKSELAPAVAIALLDKAQGSQESLPPALDILAAGVSSAQEDEKVRVQLVFENGSVLPVEMSVQAGEALANGLTEELASK